MLPNICLYEPGKPTHIGPRNLSPNAGVGSKYFGYSVSLKCGLFFYLYNMNTKSKKGKNKKTSREQIMQSALAFFRVEGINISNEMALVALKKVELSLGR